MTGQSHLQALLYTNLAELEKELRSGKVIELTMPSDATAFLLQDAHGKFCFVWERCHYGEDEEQACFPFETVEQMILWLFSCLYTNLMTRQEAKERYGNFSSSHIVTLL